MVTGSLARRYARAVLEIGTAHGDDQIFEDEAGKTRYTARVRHFTVAGREQHEQMGFHQGWGMTTDQLAALASSL